MDANLHAALCTWREAESQAREIELALTLALVKLDRSQAVTLSRRLTEQRRFADEMLRTTMAMVVGDRP